MTRRTPFARATVLAAVLAALVTSACSRPGPEPPPPPAITTAADIDLKETTVRNVTDRAVTYRIYPIAKPAAIETRELAAGAIDRFRTSEALEVEFRNGREGRRLFARPGQPVFLPLRRRRDDRPLPRLPRPGRRRRPRPLGPDARAGRGQDARARRRDRPRRPVRHRLRGRPHRHHGGPPVRGPRRRHRHRQGHDRGIGPERRGRRASSGRSSSSAWTPPRPTSRRRRSSASTFSRNRTPSCGPSSRPSSGRRAGSSATTTPCRVGRRSRSGSKRSRTRKAGPLRLSVHPLRAGIKKGAPRRRRRLRCHGVSGRLRTRCRWSPTKRRS